MLAELAKFLFAQILPTAIALVSIKNKEISADSAPKIVFLNDIHRGHRRYDSRRRDSRRNRKRGDSRRSRRSRGRDSRKRKSIINRKLLYCDNSFDYVDGEGYETTVHCCPVVGGGDFASSV